MSPASRAALKRVTKPATKPAAKPRGRGNIGALPEWDLTDLYSSLNAPEVKRDLEKSESECLEFERAYKGKLAAPASGSDVGGALAAAVKRYEAINELLGRLMSYAGLLQAGNTADPVIAKFYGDMQERITAASSHLLFF